jgi:hypothetical protein
VTNIRLKQVLSIVAKGIGKTTQRQPKKKLNHSKTVKITNNMKPEQIKFRGFRTDGKGWVDGGLAFMFDNPKHACIMPSCYFATRHFGEEDSNGNPILEDTMALGGFVSVVPESLGQFTGQTDKNGKEIFGAIGEKGGDVIAIGDFVLFVKFENCSFRLFSSAIKNSDGNPLRWGELSRIWDLGYHKSIEIIGNQFETK